MMKRSLVLAIAASLGAACSDPPPPKVKKPPRAAKPQVDTPQEPDSAALGAERDDYSYSPIGKRDPFRSLFEDLQKSGEEEERTPLEEFELDQLKLVGIVSRIATPYALVEDPTGKGHTLRRGTLIGRNRGRVSQIKPECVVVRERYSTYSGKTATNETEICLPKPSELNVD